MKEFLGYKCGSCKFEFVVNRQGVYDSKNMMCPRCHTPKAKIVYTVDRGRIEWIFLDASDVEEANKLVKRLLDSGGKNGHEFDEGALLKCSYKELLKLEKEYLL